MNEHPTAPLLPAGGDVVSSPFVARATFGFGGQVIARNARHQQAAARWLACHESTKTKI